MLDSLRRGSFMVKGYLFMKTMIIILETGKMEKLREKGSISILKEWPMKGTGLMI